MKLSEVVLEIRTRLEVDTEEIKATIKRGQRDIAYHVNNCEGGKKEKKEMKKLFKKLVAGHISYLRNEEVKRLIKASPC